MEKDITVRYTVPNKLDIAPYGTIYKVMLEDDKGEYYIQLGASDSSWMRMSNFLEFVFSDYLNDEGFVDECLRLFNRKSTTPLNKIQEIIKDK